MTKNIIEYPVIYASMGGARRVQYTARYAWITLADDETVRVPRSQLPRLDLWASFTLADAAVKAKGA